MKSGVRCVGQWPNYNCRIQAVGTPREFLRGAQPTNGLYVGRNGNQDDFPMSSIRDAEAYMAAHDVGDGLKIPMKLKEKSVTVRCPYVMQPMLCSRCGELTDLERNGLVRGE